MQDPPAQSPIANDVQAAESSKPASRERSLDRVIEMLEFLHINQHPIGIGELAKQLGELRQDLARAALRRAAEFSTENMAERYLAAYRGLLPAREPACA